MRLLGLFLCLLLAGGFFLPSYEVYDYPSAVLAAITAYAVAKTKGLAIRAHRKPRH